MPTLECEWWVTVASTAATVCCSCRHHDRRRRCLRRHAAPDARSTSMSTAGVFLCKSPQKKWARLSQTPVVVVVVFVVVVVVVVTLNRWPGCSLHCQFCEVHELEEEYVHCFQSSLCSLWELRQSFLRRPLFSLVAEFVLVSASKIQLCGKRVPKFFGYFLACPALPVLTLLSTLYKMVRSALVRLYVGSFPVSNITSHVCASCLVSLYASKLTL